MGERSRSDWLTRAWRLELFTISYNILEGAIGITAGVLAGSVALIGFGVDSCIEVTSAAIVALRLRAEMRGQSSERAEHVERQASRAAGGLLLLLAVYLVVESARRLLGFGEHAEKSIPGIVLTAISLVVMPLLGRAKLAAAKALGSGSVRADSFETITCAWLSWTTLLGLVLNAAYGAWWADPVAGLVLVPLIAHEGVEAWRGIGCCAGD